MAKELKILGIETSCDETAAAVVSNSDNSKLPKILSNVIFFPDQGSQSLWWSCS